MLEHAHILACGHGHICVRKHICTLVHKLILHACSNTCMRTYLRAGMITHVHICVHKHVCTLVHKLILHACSNTCMHTYLRAGMVTHVHICVHKHVCTLVHKLILHARSNTCMHTYLRAGMVTLVHICVRKHICKLVPIPAHNCTNSWTHARNYAHMHYDNHTSIMGTRICALASKPTQCQPLGHLNILSYMYKRTYSLIFMHQ